MAGHVALTNAPQHKRGCLCIHCERRRLKRRSSLADTPLIDKRARSKRAARGRVVALGKGIDVLFPNTKPAKRTDRNAPFGGAWAIGDDEDGWCAMGPKRRTEEEARRDCPRTIDGKPLELDGGPLRKADGYSEIVIEIAPQLLAAVEDMHGTGLFGLTVRAVLEELVRGAIRVRILEGWARPLAGMVVSEGALQLAEKVLRRRVRKRGK